ncbi:hypothetical protein N7513_005013 [Penicillium frequentans]|nr:hypothetical protein N7513_005013 [Penicillium glabrum]
MASRQAPRASQPLLLYCNHPVPNARVKFPSTELMADYPSPYRRRPLPSLPFAGHDRITSIFPLRKHPEPELPSLETPDTTLVRIPNPSPSQATLEESIKGKNRSGLDLSVYASKNSSRSYLALKDELVHPLNTDDAAIKECYDATTIARDVLIAANQHPTERGLNQHLIVLRKNFPVVNFSSDLETFRWDIIDPEPALQLETSSFFWDRVNSIYKPGVFFPIYPMSGSAASDTHIKPPQPSHQATKWPDRSEDPEEKLTTSTLSIFLSHP